MAKKDIKFTLDTIDSRYSPVGTVKQLDSVFFYIKITENGVTKDLTGQTIKLFAIKEDKKIVEQTTKINITNQSEGLVEIELLNAAIQVHGFTYFELEISDSNGIISTADFILRVNKRVGSPEAIESTNEVSTLKEIEVYVAQAKQEIKEFKVLQSEMLKTNKSLNEQESLREEAEAKRIQGENKRIEADNLRDKKVTKLGKEVSKIKEIVSFSFREIKDINWNNGSYIDKQGDKLAFAGFSYAEIKVEEGEEYLIDGTHRWSSVCYLVKNDNGDVLLTDSAPDDGQIHNVNEKFVIPSGGTTLCINNYNNADFKNLSIKDEASINYKKESIPLEALESKLQNFYTLTYRNVDTINWVDGFYITQQGDKVPMEGYGYAVLPVVEETEVIISGTRSFQAVCYLVKDAKGNVLKHDNKGTDGETVITNEKFKIPEGGVELYISKYHFKGLKIKDYIYINFIDDSIPYDALDKQIKDFCILDYRKVDNLEFTMNHYVGENGEISPIENDSFGYTVLDVKEGTDCIITGSKAWESTCYLVKNDNGDVLLKDGRPGGVETKIENEKFTIPKSGTKLFIGKYGFRELKIKDKLFAKNITSPLKNKLICFNGDSICQGLVNNGGYAKILKDQTGCKIENRAIGGGTLSANGKGYHEICNDIANMNDDANMVILEGGINDYFQAVELGEMKPLNDFTSEVDKTTVLGGLESIFRTCIDKWLGVPIIFIIVHPISDTRYTINSKGYSFQILSEKIKEMCSKYSVAVVDLLNESGGFNCNIEKIAKKYTINEGDGIHPNEEGYKKYYAPQIKMRAESMIL